MPSVRQVRPFSILIVAVMAAVLPVFAVSEGTFERTLEVNGPVNLQIETGSGSIRVFSGSSNQVQVTGHIRASNWFSSADEDIQKLESNPPRLVKRTAIFLTPNPKSTPIALLHNLKHNQVLHEANIILTVTTADIPRVGDEERLSIEVLGQRFTAVSLSYGFMEMPDVPAALDRGREDGLRLDRNATSYFFGRHSVVASGEEGMPIWQDSLFIFLMKNAADPTQFYKIPPGQVVELGAQISV